MTDEPTPATATLPPGEVDPNALYIAVGRAIHAWEQMESRLAELYLKFGSIQFSPDNLAAYGLANRRFEARKRAVQEAAEQYFVKTPDQTKEGQFRAIVAALDELAIERHRIAHGHIILVGEFRLPNRKGYSEVSSTPYWYWAAPFYSASNLRTGPPGKNAAGIDAMHDRFSALNNAILAFKDAL